MLSLPSSSSSSSSIPRQKYDVFLSFRGEDTRKTFTDHLYAALKRNGIVTFRDDPKLEAGEEIAPELFKAIQESWCSVIVFSETYAFSSWCLEELAEIVEQRKKRGHKIYPIFYDVHPSDLRKQRGRVEEAFAKHEERYKEDKDKIQRWRTALIEVANIKGWHSTNRHESEFIGDIVRKISAKLCQTYAVVCDELIGIDSRLEELRSKMEIAKDDVRIIGICGMGGIGKTTLARVAYTQMSSHFEGKSFLADVREVSEKRGLVSLQKQLLSQILEESFNFFSVDDGKDMISHRLSQKKVLVVIDDADNFQHLKCLVGRRDWFGLGSRIIVTTRDEHLLQSYKVDDVYKPTTLNVNESLQLFNSKAFDSDKVPENDLIELAKDVVEYTGGLPLALEVLGCFFCGRDVARWRSAIERLKRDSNKEIHDRLQISYDGLEETEKNIFLDIACFFNGVGKDFVIKVLDGCEFFPDIGIDVLVKKSLIKVDEVNKCLRMHDLLQEMGRKIVRQKCVDEPGKRCRLWEENDVYHVLTKNTATEAIEGIVIDNKRELNMMFTLNANVFLKMNKLRLLKVLYHPESRDLKYLSNELRLLEWHGYPFKSLPSSFQLDNLVALLLPCSGVEQLWEGNRPLYKLKLVNLEGSRNLIKTPNFAMTPNLESLILKGCTRIADVHPSIGVLSKLKVLNLSDCKSLERFPEIDGEMKCLLELYLDGTGIEELPFSVGNLSNLVLLNLKDCNNLVSLPSSIDGCKCLKTLNLSGCSKVQTLPENLQQIEVLEELDLSETAIRKPPSFIFQFKNLKVLSFNGCKGPPSKLRQNLPSLFKELQKGSVASMALMLPPLSGLSSLTKLNLSDCNFRGRTIPSDICCLSSLETLNLSGNNFMILPATFTLLSKLHRLLLSDCKRLKKLPDLPTSLEKVIIDGCVSLEVFANPSAVRNSFDWDPALTDRLIGINSRLEELHRKIDIGEDDVLIIGICGMGGIGKTTLASVFYDQMSPHFEGNCFLDNVRAASEQHGLVSLQNKLLSSIFLEESFDLFSIDYGKGMISHRLSQMKVLVVIDDADNFQHLKCLVGRRDWFGLGSRIIVTSRDEHLLRSFGVDDVYKPTTLSAHEALQLFNLRAFNRDTVPENDFIELSKFFVEYAGGLPLALKVLGSTLYRKSVFYWKRVIRRLGISPPVKISWILKISFDRLHETEKNIFLDIACFFIGEDKDFVIKVLDGCDFYPEIRMDALIQKSLITVDEDNKLRMHNLVQQMARDIVIRGSRNPGERCRLWEEFDVYQVLSQNKATEAIEGMLIDIPRETFTLNADAFLKMKRLRLLKVLYLPNCPDPKYLSNELRLLEWHGYPFKSLPSSFQPDNLVALLLPCSRIEQPWKGNRPLSKLRIANLKGSQNLIKTPNFTMVPNLETLILEDCTRIVDVHPSIRVLRRLQLLNLRGCKNLRSLPTKIEMESLKTLILSGCSNLQRFPKIDGKMKCLLELYLDGTGIKELPSSIGRLRNLVLLDLKDCSNLVSLPCSIGGCKCLKTLILSGCSKVETLPENLQRAELLVELDLSGTAIDKPLSFFFQFKNLKVLSFNEFKGPPSKLQPNLPSLFKELQRRSADSMTLMLPPLSDCKRLISVPDLQTSIKCVCIDVCASLEVSANPKLAFDSSKYWTYFIGTNCYGLSENSNALKMLIFFLNAYANARRLFDIVIPGSEIPEWFCHQKDGCSIRIRLPRNIRNDNTWMGVAFCCIFVSAFTDNNDCGEDVIMCKAVIHGRNSGQVNWSGFLFGREYRRPRMMKEHLWLRYWSRDKLYPFSSENKWGEIQTLPSTNLEDQDCDEIFESSITSDVFKVKKCGIRIMYEKDLEEFRQLKEQRRIPASVDFDDRGLTGDVGESESESDSGAELGVLRKCLRCCSCIPFEI